MIPAPAKLVSPAVKPLYTAFGLAVWANRKSVPSSGAGRKGRRIIPLNNRKNQPEYTQNAFKTLFGSPTAHFLKGDTIKVP